jgi:hypothetical protein
VASTDQEGLAFNFVAPKRPAVQRDMRRVKQLAIAAVVVILAVATFGVRSYLMKQRLLAQQKIQQEITALQKNQALFRKTRAQAANVAEWNRESRHWLEHYAYITSILPGSEELYVTTLGIGQQGSIRLSVQARSGEVLARLDKQLRDAGYEVKPQAITPGSDRYGYNFRSSVELIVPSKMKVDLSKLKSPPPRPADDISLATGMKGPAGSSAAAVYGGGE